LTTGVPTRSPSSVRDLLPYGHTGGPAYNPDWVQQARAHTLATVPDPILPPMWVRGPFHAR